jgi:hypothetical protein
LIKEVNMENATLDEVERLVDHLTPLDQVRLLAYLTPRIARTVTAMYPAAAGPALSGETAWKEFFRIGDTLSADDPPGTPTLTSAVLMMRR